MRTRDTNEPWRKDGCGGEGFTLVELLVVLVIVATLASVGFAVMASVIVKAKVVSAKSGAVGLESAVNHYASDYGVFPTVLRSAEAGKEGVRADAGLMDILLGINKMENPRAAGYYNGKSASESGKGVGILSEEGGQDSSGTLVDPFGSAYHVIVDEDHDGRVPDPDPKSKRKWLWQGVIVYSAGPDGNLETWEDNVRSWK
jgi:prepilin-type N-terminal cleavage/methylation domain-containing protein